MAHGRPRRRAGDGGPAGVGEQVEHVHRAPGLLNPLPGKVPVCRLLGKHAGMLEVHQPHVKGEIPVAHLPPLGDVPALPLPAAGVGPGVPGVRPFPALVGAGGIPDSLGVGPHQQLVPPAPQLFPPAALQQPIIRPCPRCPHGAHPLCPLMGNQDIVSHRNKLVKPGHYFSFYLSC